MDPFKTRAKFQLRLSHTFKIHLRSCIKWASAYNVIEKFDRMKCTYVNLNTEHVNSEQCLFVPSTNTTNDTWHNSRNLAIWNLHIYAMNRRWPNLEEIWNMEKLEHYFVSRFMAEIASHIGISQVKLATVSRNHTIFLFEKIDLLIDQQICTAIHRLDHSFLDLECARIWNGDTSKFIFLSSNWQFENSLGLDWPWKWLRIHPGILCVCRFLLCPSLECNTPGSPFSTCTSYLFFELWSIHHSANSRYGIRETRVYSIHFNIRICCGMWGGREHGSHWKLK